MRDIRPVPSSPQNPELLPDSPLSSIPKLPSRPVSPEAGSAIKPNTAHTLKPPAVTFNKKNIDSKQPAKISSSATSIPRRPAPAAPQVLPTPVTNKVRIGPRERKMIAGLLGLVILATLLAALIFLPGAQIKLVVRTAPLLVEEQLTVQAAQVATPGVIPGSAFFREVAVQDTAAVTSTEVIGKKARGTIQLVNRTVEEQKIKERSRLVTKDNKLFYMVGSATIAPNSSVNIEIEAAEAGESGNISPQRLNLAALDSSAQSLVYGEATTALTGGSGETVAIIKEADLTAAAQQAGERARSQVEQEIRGELPSGWIVLEESWTTEAINFTTAATVDSRQPTIPYEARIAVRVIGYEKSALETHLRQALEKRMDEEYMLFPGPISYTTKVNEVTWENAQASISARVTHTTIPKLSLETLREKLAGRNSAEAKRYLEGLPGVRAVDISLQPFWVQSIPRIDKRINLDIQPERQP